MVKHQITLRSCLFILALGLADQLSESAEYDLQLSIHCPKKDLKRGDEIPIVFTITNKGESTYSYEKRNYDRSGRMWDYSLVAKREDGTTVADPRENYKEGLGGGLSGQGQIKRGESFTKTIALNRWALVKNPGRYTVTATHCYWVRDPDAKQVEGIVRAKEVQVNSEPIEIVVKPRTDEEMAEHIKQVSKRLETIQMPRTEWPHHLKPEIRRERETIIKKLMYTCDRRIVPTLLDLMYNSRLNNDAFWASEAFVCYLPRDRKIKDKLVEAAKNRGLVAGMQPALEAFDCSESEFKEIIAVSLMSDDPDIFAEGVGAAQEHPDDDHMPALIAVATNVKPADLNKPSYRTARERAIYAIAYNRTYEGVQALKALLDDPDESIGRMASDAIRYAYRRHRIYPEPADREYTAQLVSIAMDCNDPRQTSMIVEIARTRTEEGVKAIKTLLEDPNKNVPLAEADEGVKAIRDLLRNPNKDVRDMTAQTIRFIYKSYPGRPLRYDDFGDEFRENFEEQRKKLLERLRRQSAR